jgi:hypothetical protein
MGDDSAGVSTDDSGMSVVTVVGSNSLPAWPLLVIAAIVVYMVMTEKS